MRRTINRLADMKAARTVWMGLLTLTLLAGCKKDDATTDAADPQTVATYKVAVMVKGDDMDQWQRTAKWALENLEEAQRGMKNKVRLELQFKDQNAADISEYMQQVAEDTTFAAIVGPSTSLRAEQMAEKLSETVLKWSNNKAYRKPMISPTATAVEYQRKFAKSDFIWNMSECDIHRLEASVAMMSTTMQGQMFPFTVITPDKQSEGEQQNTNTEWLSFLAEEYGLKLKDIKVYRTPSELRNTLEQLDGYYPLTSNQVVFTPSGEEDIRVMHDYVEKTIQRIWQDEATVYHPHVFCSEGFVSPTTANILGTGSTAMYSGLDIYADPESGFIQAFDEHFGREIIVGEAQFYDAICMVAFAAARAQQTGETLNEAMHTLVKGGDGKVNAACYPAAMRTVFQQVQAGQCPSIAGACGNWDFRNGSTSITGTTYRYWRYYQGKFITAEYVSAIGSRRSTSSEHVWEWAASSNQDFGKDADVHITYPELKDNWALLIAASKGWSNYRFQADVFAMYHILKNAGYSDDHIILIMEDDLANNPDNIYDAGAIRTSETGSNLYVPQAIDYKLSTLTPADIGDILHGKSSERLPEVIKADSNDNIFIFWSSHGSPGSMDFGGNERMGYGQMKQILQQTPHRKIMMAVEACYSGGLGEACTGLPGVLFFTAASPYETSHADNWSQKVGVYMSNGFTAGFQQALTAEPSIALNRLYYELARNTSGSHVKVYNIPQYGSIYSSNMGEYLNIKKK